MSIAHSDISQVTQKAFVDGETQLAIEVALDDSLSIREGSIIGWSALRYALFNEASDGAVVGKSGWLFTDEEYAIDSGFDERLQTNLARIQDWTRTLEQLGATTVIVLLPDKARIVFSMLTRTRAPLIQERYQTALDTLNNGGLQVVDLQQVLANLQEQGQAFLRTDTHWTPEGARAVAQAVAPQINSATSTRTEYSTQSGTPEAYKGDLLAFLNLGIFAGPLGVEPDTVTPYQTAPISSGGLDLFGETSVAATLVGTSYSALPEWNFVGFLQEASSTDIISKAQLGLGPFVPMQTYIDELRSGEPIPEVVIWEIPERYLTLEESSL